MGNDRQRLIEYVKHGGEPVCSPQIGAGAGFDAKMVGKEWLSEVTLVDTKSACGLFDMVPLLNAGLPERMSRWTSNGPCNPMSCFVSPTRWTR